MIVESPTKEKTLAGFLGKEYLIRSCKGHVRDLPAHELGVDTEKNFKPTYVVIETKKKTLDALKSAAGKADKIILATDYDREGEAIAWHLVEILNPPKTKIARVVFHEITKEAIVEAFGSPRGLDEDLIAAQQARRVLDRLVGYKLSPLLWKKVRQGLSAGRVQSVAVRLIVEREAEIKKFNVENYWTIHALLNKAGQTFQAELSSWKGREIWQTQTHQLFAQSYKITTTVFKNVDEAQALAGRIAGKSFEVLEVEEANRKRSPLAPFTTSTMAQAVSQALGFSAQKTMRLAQNLYENGFITYMRTDSVFVAQSAQKAARAFVQEKFGVAYVPAASPVYKTKTKGAQEAHEAIRPTLAARTPEALGPGLAKEEAALYDLIWRRFLASQMTDALYHVMTAALSVKNAAEAALFRSSGRRLVFDGFLRLYREGSEEADRDLPVLPPLKKGEEIFLAKPSGAVEARAHQSSAPPRYNEASLVLALEENGIGRPSTYAPILHTVVERGYAFLKERRFYPTETGALVTDILKSHFPEIVDLSFTAQVEGSLDEVAQGKRAWQTVVKEFYAPFSKELQKAEARMVKVKIQPKDSGQKCVRCGARMFIKESRFGRYLLCENNPKTCNGKTPLDAQGQPILPETTSEPCPKCGKSMLKKKTPRGMHYLACQDYPQCRTSISLDRQGNKIVRKPAEPTDLKCERCKSPIVKRYGPRGPFLACSAFPRCRFTKSIPKEGEKGEQGEKGEKR